MLRLITYDIVDDRRRNEVASELLNVGHRVQYSVFECQLDEAALDEVVASVGKLIDWDEDIVRYYTLCERDEAQVRIEGSGHLNRDWDYFVE